MKAMLLKPIDGLEVGKTYDLGWKYRTDCWILKDEWLQDDEKHGWTGSQLFENFFVFQEIPEQIKEQVEQSITSAHFSSRSIAGPKEYADAVCGVLSGSESGLDD